MYWNVFDDCVKNGEKMLNRNIGCIEIPPENIYLIFLFKLNRNIGCIEIEHKHQLYQDYLRWTVT